MLACSKFIILRICWGRACASLGSENSSKNRENRPDLRMTYCQFPEPLPVFKTARSVQVLSERPLGFESFLEINAFRFKCVLPKCEAGETIVNKSEDRGDRVLFSLREMSQTYPNLCPLPVSFLLGYYSDKGHESTSFPHAH